MPEGVGWFTFPTSKRATPMRVDRFWRLCSLAACGFGVLMAWDGNYTPTLLAAIVAILVTMLRRLNDLLTAIEAVIHQQKGPRHE